MYSITNCTVMYRRIAFDLSMVILAAFAVVATGCSDHRISLAAFMEIQQPDAPAADPIPSDVLTAQLDRLLGPYTVGTNDVLLISLTGVTAAGSGQTDLFPPIQARVDRQGQIRIPMLGATSVAGLELQDIERQLQQTLIPTYLKEGTVHVELQSVDTTPVLVVGAVTLPGLIELQRTQRNLLYAIVGAGGASELASGEATLRRIRRPAERVTFDLRDPFALSAVLALDPLDAGDIVEVHAAVPNTVIVGGLVNVPGPQIYPSGTEATVLQVLATAGGLRTDVYPREATLIRRMKDGTDTHVKLDLRRLACGKDPNITLAAGDILWVPETAGTRTVAFLNSTLFFRAGATVSYNVTGIEYLNRRNQQTGQFGSNVQNQVDPLGFLSRGTALQTIIP